jgi:hypothetical protein
LQRYIPEKRDLYTHRRENLYLKALVLSEIARVYTAQFELRCVTRHTHTHTHSCVRTFDPRVSEIQVTRYHEPEGHSNNAAPVACTIQVRERQSQVTSNYTEFNLRLLQYSV